MTAERITAATITPEVLASLRATAQAAIDADEFDNSIPGNWEAEVYNVRRRGIGYKLLPYRESDGTEGSVSCIVTDGEYGLADGRTVQHIATFDPLTIIAILDYLESLS